MAKMNTYPELGAQSTFSFLRSAASPEELAIQAARLEIPALAISDYGGLYGVPRFCCAARQAGIRPIVGTSIDIEGIGRIRLLCESQQGYRNLCKLITQGHAGRPKGHCVATIDELQEYAKGLHCIAGPGLRYLSQKLIDPLLGIFSSSHFAIESNIHLTRASEKRHQRIKAMASHLRVPALVTNDVQHIYAWQKPLLDVMRCIEERCTLADAGHRLLSNAERRLKSHQEIDALLKKDKKPLHHAIAVGEACEFSFNDIGYKFPTYPTPQGEPQIHYLQELVWSHAHQRYGTLSQAHRQQLQKELQVIAKLHLAGYFLLVWDIVRFAKENNIMVQGRGSAANSAVCYVLGITAIDPIAMDLLFERFLSEERGEWPDIDLDLPSGAKREAVIQYVYERYGANGAAMTANVITYRSKSALRETGKALGFSAEQLDKASKVAGRWGSIENSEELQGLFQQAGFDTGSLKIANWLKLSAQLLNQPRHLGQHSGGMVIASGDLSASCPIEPASMKNRQVIQWDKDDCAQLGIIKVDLLGLGMLNALEEAIPLIKQTEGIDIDYAALPQDDPKVYDMICKADTVGVFQIESRGQMSMLPRLRPRCFYDLVIEIALVRPGPIVGQMVHPYLQRRDGLEPVRYPHPCLIPALKRTLGIPIFQEQLLKIAVSIAGFTGGEAEELRRAMGFKSPGERMTRLINKLATGMTRNGISQDIQEEVIENIQSFAHYGFPESHSASFALIAYASAYLKTHHPAAFLCALLNSQPMGFYNPSTLVKDAQRHAVRVLPIDITKSFYRCTLEDAHTVRLGLCYAHGLSMGSAEKILHVREKRPFENAQELKSILNLNQGEWATLAELGAFAPLGLSRRQALWQLSKARDKDPLFASRKENAASAPLPEMNLADRVSADYRNAGLSVGPHPMHFARAELNARGILSSADLPYRENGQPVRAAGLVTVRQRPMTAKGILFVTLEDEWGFINLIISPELFEKSRPVAVGAPGIVATGNIQNHRGIIHIKCLQIESLDAI